MVASHLPVNTQLDERVCFGNGLVGKLINTAAIVCVTKTV